jgi:hypothetical protein
MRMIVKKDGKLIRLTKELKKNGFSADQLFMQNMPAERPFASSEKITMNGMYSRMLLTLVSYSSMS